MNELHLFAGAGGGILGGMLLGHTPVCAVEIEPYPRKALLQRQRDGILPKFPIWDDVRTFDGKPWRGIADIVCGGFPCTDISSARTNSRANGEQKGLDGDSSGLWFSMERIIEEVEPDACFIENSPNLRTKGLVAILKSLDKMGYDARWGVFGCGSIGADHYRDRMFILAYSREAQRQGRRLSCGTYPANADTSRSNWWENKPGLERVAYGMANQMDRLAAIGNGQVPAVVELAWKTLSKGLIK